MESKQTQTCPLSLALLSNGHLLITGSVVWSQANKELRDLFDDQGIGLLTAAV